MPRLGVNDDYVTLVSWLVKDGETVKEKQPIAEIETSKESSEILSPASGVIKLLVSDGSEIEVGNKVAVLGEAKCLEETVEDGSCESVDLRMTEKARQLVKENNIDISLLPKDKLIREKDVLQFVNKTFSITESKNNSLILYGGAGFAEIAIDILRVTHAYEICGIVDMKYPELESVMGVPVIGGDDQLQELYDKGYHKVLNCVGAYGGRYKEKSPYNKLKSFGFEFVNVIHAKAIIEPSVKLGEGILICAGAIIGAQVRIGCNCVINAGAIISHDCIISDNCHVASGAVLAGIVTVGENTLIGQNVTVYSRVKIGNNVVIENGCCVFKDVPDNTIVRYKGNY